MLDSWILKFLIFRPVESMLGQVLQYLHPASVKFYVKKTLTFRL